jgi:hypothetical protein
MLQAKDALPKGELAEVYPEGVMFVTYSLLAMSSSEVPGVKKGPLAEALKYITDPTARAAAGGGKGRGTGRGRGRGGRGSASRGGSEAAGDDEDSVAVTAAADADVADGEEQQQQQDDDAEAEGGGGGRGRGKKQAKKISWKKAPGDALERAAGELYASQVAVGSRWVAVVSCVWDTAECTESYIAWCVLWAVYVSQVAVGSRWV